MLKNSWAIFASVVARLLPSTSRRTKTSLFLPRSGLMNGCAHAESLVPPIEGRVRQLWDSIEVSEDTAETGTGVGDEGAEVADGEVVSLSGFFDFEL
ncbi:hypothetical protein DY000_02014844 [Brassica cretica]|uniref:Uncharacterized protein n=1 Tax=Brassica cretica TaxID=69181 RepID=A0ABQ7D8L6_BRACR|nr:hypothetical protein DY000_02014844 [Brassica cretica]